MSPVRLRDFPCDYYISGETATGTGTWSGIKPGRSMRPRRNFFGVDGTENAEVFGVTIETS